VAAIRAERAATAMNPDQFQRLDALYDAAAALDPADRGQFIEQNCADDEEVRRALLDAFGSDARSGLTEVVQRAAAVATTSAADTDTTWAGRRVGPYRIERPLGHGGMGAVYLAIRDDSEFHKQVAIKTLKFELESGPAIARFRQERQILAHLEHPNIARLLDGGTAEHGTPYIALEYIDGVQIIDWCQQKNLSISDRLRLFCQVCDAVQYAHQHLIVHRDIKPGNILVTPDGVPKLLDFGIAKLLDAEALAGFHTMQTSGQMMTPDYVSPEQVRGEPVSTATDVYSLGAVLYELLTGSRPHALRSYDPAEIARVVCETAIRPPSTQGHRHLRGDLDNIVLKAMQKEPSRRYSSATALAEDIRRYLDGLPVSARADTAVYRAAKFVRRHRLGVAATVAVVASLAVGVALALREARIAERRFAQVRELANTFLFQFYDQVTPLAGSTAVRASIVETAQKYLDGLAAEVGNDRELTRELAQAYERLGDVQGRTRRANLGQLDNARRSYQRALDLYTRLGTNAASPPELRAGAARVLMSLSTLEFDANREDTAEPLARRALDVLGDGLSDPRMRTLRAMGEANLGEVRRVQGHASEAVTLLASAHRTLVDLRESGYDDPDLSLRIVSAHQRLARAKVDAGDLDGALNHYLDMLRHADPCDERATPVPACRTLSILESWTADLYAGLDRPNLNDPDKAVPLYEHALAIQQRIAALDDHDRQAHFDLAARYGKLGDAVWMSDPQRAVDLYERALATAKALVSKEQYQLFQDAYDLAVSRPLIRLHRFAEARKSLNPILAASRAEAQRPNAQYADRLSEISIRRIPARLLFAEGKTDEAKELLRGIVKDLEIVRADGAGNLTPIFFMSDAYRMLAEMSTGAERREALLNSARAWHSWPATSFTKREEQRDLDAAAK
jgi:tetratricopeptide (TPR) repeat protein